jgi:ribose-phosphate pyrophosphokinase
LSGEKTEITGVSATVQGRCVVIYDDMIRTGGSLMQAAKAYREAGARSVYAVATHGVFPGDSWARIKNSGLLDGIGCTDTHPNVLALPKKEIRIESVAKLLTHYLASA